MSDENSSSASDQVTSEATVVLAESNDRQQLDDVFRYLSNLPVGNLFNNSIEYFKFKNIAQESAADSMIILTTLLSAALGYPLYTAILEQNVNESVDIIEICVDLVGSHRCIEVDSIKTLKSYVNDNTNSPKAFIVRANRVPPNHITEIVEIIKASKKNSCLIAGSHECVSSTKCESLVKFALTLDDHDFVSLLANRWTENIEALIVKRMIQRFNEKVKTSSVNVPFFKEILNDSVDFFIRNRDYALYVKNLISCISLMRNTTIDPSQYVLGLLLGDNVKSFARPGDVAVLDATPQDYWFACHLMKNANASTLNLSDRQLAIHTIIKKANIELAGPPAVGGLESEGDKILYLQGNDCGVTINKILQLMEGEGHSISVSTLNRELKYLCDQDLITGKRKGNKLEYFVYELSFTVNQCLPKPSIFLSEPEIMELSSNNPFVKVLDAPSDQALAIEESTVQNRPTNGDGC